MLVHTSSLLSRSTLFLSLLSLLSSSLPSVTASSAPSCSSSVSALTTWEEIHQTLHTYPLAIDTKDFGLLSAVFASSATANYTGPLSDLSGLAAIQAGLAASVAKIDSQHLLGTTVISITNCTAANSTTYFQASLFGKGAYAGQVLYLYGLYADVLALVKGVGWRIVQRTLVFQGPGMVGNASVIAQ